MDTKWKKSKSVFSFMAFATGLTVIVTNLIPAAGMVSAFGTDILEGQSDYQESGDFRDLISGKLSELIGVATAGKDDSGYVMTGGSRNFRMSRLWNRKRLSWRILRNMGLQQIF